MEQDITVEFRCTDCQTSLTARVGGDMVLCPTPGCRRRFRAWSKRKADLARESILRQPSVKQKHLHIMPDGRLVTSHVYDPVPRYIVRGLLDLIEDLEVIRLLLTGISTRLGLPVVLVFPTEGHESEYPKRYQEPEPGVGIVVPETQEFSFLCFFVRKILGLETYCHECDASRFRESMGRAVSSPNPVSHYFCWAGSLEVSSHVALNQIGVGVFITGQIIYETDEALAKRREAFSVLERECPRIKTGIPVSVQELREKGMNESRIVALWHRLGLAEGESLMVNSSTLPTIILEDAAAMNRLVNRDEDLQKIKEKVSWVVQLIDEYVLLTYSERRTLREQRFLTELFALMECLPREVNEIDISVFSHTQELMNRISRFHGFRGGALCAITGNDQRTATPVLLIQEDVVGERTTTCSVEGNLSPCIPAALFNKLYEKGGITYDCRNNLDDFAGRSFVAAIRQQLTGIEAQTNIAWMGLIVLDEEYAIPASGRERTQRSASATKYLLLILWDRVPWTSHDPGDRISDKSTEFFLQMAHELGAGLQLWLSLLTLEEEQDERRRLVANYVHGLKSCVHTARAKTDIIELVLESPKTPGVKEEIPSVESLLRGISYDLDSFSRQITLTNRFTVVDIGKPEYVIEYFEKPSRILQQCVASLSEGANRRKIVVRVTDEVDDEVVVKCDPGALEVAFTALLDNAIKYSFSDRTIDVRLKEDDRTVIIEIEDYGQGIGSTETEKIFEKFYRGKQMDPQRYVPGTGIGLTVAKSVVEAHGGEIRVSGGRGDPPSGKSTSAVRGFKVCFKVSLPKRKDSHR